MEIRAAQPTDARALLDLQHALDRESRFMLLEPGERPDDVDGLAHRLATLGRSFLLLAIDDATAAGYVEVSVLDAARARRTGYVVMGVRADYGGRGVGGALLQAARAGAVDRELHRLELTVMAHNRRALNLYVAQGFQVEGLRRNALEIDGVPVDEYYMGALL